jgi:hypothetical protein
MARRPSPCLGYALAANSALLMNFGGDNGAAAWNLTDLIMGDRKALSEVGFL